MNLNVVVNGINSSHCTLCERIFSTFLPHCFAPFFSPIPSPSFSAPPSPFSSDAEGASVTIPHEGFFFFFLSKYHKVGEKKKQSMKHFHPRFSRMAVAVIFALRTSQKVCCRCLPSGTPRLTVNRKEIIL